MVSSGSRESSIHKPQATAIPGDQGMHICDAWCKGYKCYAVKSESVIVS